MSTQLPTWRFHAVDPSLLVRVDHDDEEASVRPRAKSSRPASSGSNAAGKAAATRKMDQLKEQIAVRKASHDLEQLKMQIAARQAAVAAPSAANVASVARVKKRAQQPAADKAEAGASAVGAVSPAKRLRKAAAAKPAPSAAPAPAPPLGKVDNGRSLTTTTTSAASSIDDDERSLTDGQLRRVLRALDAAGLLAAPGAEARAQAALRPLLAGPSAPAALLPLTALPPPPIGGPATATR